MKFFDKTWKLALSGAVAGLLVALLAIYGNPANMAICVACFIRDSAGALKLHTAAPVQYFRPEIVGFVCGSFLLALLTKEYKSTAGSSPMVRFILGAAMMIGALAQKSRMCFAGSIRDVILMKNFDLLSIIAALFAVMAVYNLAAGNFHLGFSGQPIAHSQHLWNILGMYVVGFAAVLAGGCPLRQLILAGQGSSDSAVTFLGRLRHRVAHGGGGIREVSRRY